MWATCPRPEPAPGFSLLELLVVLAVLGLLVGIVAPRLSTQYDSSVFAYQRSDVIKQINALGYQAFQRRQEFKLGHVAAPDPAIPLQLPPGWELHADPPLHYRANGVCEGGRMQMRYGERRFEMELQPPFCQVAQE